MPGRASYRSCAPALARAPGGAFAAPVLSPVGVVLSPEQLKIDDLFHPVLVGHDARLIHEMPGLLLEVARRALLRRRDAAWRASRAGKPPQPWPWCCQHGVREDEKVFQEGPGARHLGQ